MSITQMIRAKARNCRAPFARRRREEEQNEIMVGGEGQANVSRKTSRLATTLLSRRHAATRAKEICSAEVDAVPENSTVGGDENGDL
jgi:hypothetical protein